jgi:hypothetical protein
VTEQPQWLRLVDVLVIGPYMIASARSVKSPVVRAGLVVAAGAAIAFNASDWLRDFPERGYFGERQRANPDPENDLAGGTDRGPPRNPRRCP